MERYQKLRSGGIAWDSIREYVKERDDDRRCLYSGHAADLTLDLRIDFEPPLLKGPWDIANDAPGGADHVRF